ncbi:AlpA family transcriptional regulator [Hahella sp. HN01]|uniref:helix-turn-helix transcriptional regulator n=1 Tax=Hahella sp. HN01 TaxID=2847262 RepID=UPI001C1EEB30|nr:AlpA family transcriptional regulator [Hahella sp. HN01]MBU6951617.1 AlpA family transcriptional regulator [Hahella sp. HN01]
MAEMIFRIKETTKLTGLSRSTIYERVANGSFPPPVHLGERAVGWFESSLDDWQASLKAGVPYQQWVNRKETHH